MKTALQIFEEREQKQCCLQCMNGVKIISGMIEKHRENQEARSTQKR